MYALICPLLTSATEAAMTPDERLIDERRKELRDLIERPLPVVNRPLWPCYSQVCMSVYVCVRL